MILDEPQYGVRIALHIAYVLAATMGLRRGEILGLRWSDIDFTTGLLQIGQVAYRIDGQLVLEEDAKSDESTNEIPIPEPTLKALRAHKKRQMIERTDMVEVWRDHGLVCASAIGTPLEPRNLNRHFEGIRSKLDIPGVRIHDLRHSMVTLLLVLGVPPHIVQALARHSGMEITMQLYAHANLAEMRKAMNQLGKALG